MDVAHLELAELPPPDPQAEPVEPTVPLVTLRQPSERAESFIVPDTTRLVLVALVLVLFVISRFVIVDVELFMSIGLGVVGVR